MARYRDARTGEYISKEQAKSRDKSTWVKETAVARKAFLKEIYNKLVEQSFPSKEFDSDLILMDDIVEIFAKLGLKV